MKWTRFPLGPIQTNCYILENENNEALIIDPGEDPEKIINNIKGYHLTPLAIILTHAHFDHIGAMDVLREKWSIPVYLHKNEADWPTDPVKNASHSFPIIEDMVRKPADHIIDGETCLTIGHFSFNIYETPGHSPGSISFYFPNEGVIFSGDTLMDGSIGRTDLYEGNYEDLMVSIQEKLLRLPQNTIVAPGHGFETTILQEVETNPFL